MLSEARCLSRKHHGKKRWVFSNPLEERRLPGGGVGQRLQHKALTGKVRGCRAAGQASEVQMKPLAQRWQPEEPGLARIRGVLSFQVPPCAGCGVFRLPQTRLCESNAIALILLASAGCAVSIPPPDLPKTRAHVKPREERNFLSRVNKPILITTSPPLRSPLRSLLRRGLISAVSRVALAGGRAVGRERCLERSPAGDGVGQEHPGAAWHRAFHGTVRAAAVPQGPGVRTLGRWPRGHQHGQQGRRRASTV